LLKRADSSFTVWAFLRPALVDRFNERTLTEAGSCFSFLIQDFDLPLVSGLFGGRMLQKAFASFSVIAL